MISISELLQEQQALVRKLHGFAFPEAARLIATLSLFPEFAANTIRIEALLEHLRENVASAGLQLPDDAIKELDSIAGEDPSTLNR